MTQFEPNAEHAGGMASLQVAEAHLTTLLNLSGSLDGKAMFIVGADLALFGVFVGAIAALDASWLAIIPAAVIMAAIVAFGWRTVRPRELGHFPVPSLALAFRGSGQPNDQLAWLYVEAIRDATLSTARDIESRVRALIWLAIASALHIVAMGVALAVVLNV